MIPCEPNLCTGCGACAAACEENAVTLVQNNEGFLVAGVDATSCINCGKCKAVCPVNNKPSITSRISPSAFVAYSLCDKTRESSNSGGIFHELASDILHRGGIAVGVELDNHFHAKHRCINNENELPLIMRSKFMQSNTGRVFRQVKDALLQGKEALFVGMPCQITGLLSYLGKDFENLVTISFPCFGIPSQKYFDKFIDYVLPIHNKSKDELVNIIFDAKKASNSRLPDGRVYRFVFRDGSKIDIPRHENIFANAWDTFMLSPDHCSNCDSVQISAFSDLVLGNFWGLGSVLKFDGSSDIFNKGASMVIVHSQKGMKALNNIRDKIFLQQRPFIEAASTHWHMITNRNNHIIHQNKKNNKNIYNDSINLPMVAFAKKYEYLQTSSRATGKIVPYLQFAIYYIQRLKNLFIKEK